MSAFTIAAIFLIVWWVVLFAVLPWGIRGQAEEENVVFGSEPGAPVVPHLWKKVGVTTAIATVLTTLFVVGTQAGWLDWQDWPFLPDVPEGYSDS